MDEYFTYVPDTDTRHSNEDIKYTYIQLLKLPIQGFSLVSDYVKIFITDATQCRVSTTEYGIELCIPIDIDMPYTVYEIASDIFILRVRTIIEWAIRKENQV